MSKTASYPSPAESLPASASSRHFLGRNFFQTTIRQAIYCQGIGLHSGRHIRLSLSPAPEDSGISFKRSDCPDSRFFPVSHKHVVSAHLATVISPMPESEQGDTPSGQCVATIEHLLAALHANGIDNVLVTVDGPEIPIMDGSASDFSFLLGAAGLQTLKAPRRQIEILRPVCVEGAGGAWARFSPNKKAQLSFDIRINFPFAIIGQQRYQGILDAATFRRDIAPARTFIDVESIENLQSRGLSLGGSLKNALVVENDRVLNPRGLRYKDEFVRHKLLDTIGDLYCTGRGFIGHFESFKSGHSLNNRLLHALFAKTENWRLVPAKYNLSRPFQQFAA